MKKLLSLLLSIIMTAALIPCDFAAYAADAGTSVSPTSITKLKSRNDPDDLGFSVTWKKVSNASGYQIQVCRDKTFPKDNTTNVNVKKSLTSGTIGTGWMSLGKEYYVRIRVYRTVSGKKYYSAWSSTKSVGIVLTPKNTCKSKNGHSRPCGNSGKWFDKRSQLQPYLSAQFAEYLNDEVSFATSILNTPHGYEAWSCADCGRWTMNYKFSYVPTLSGTSYTYDGKVKRPKVTIKCNCNDGKTRTIPSSYYTVTYSGNGKSVGKYKVTIEFTKDYDGSTTGGIIERYYTIKPKSTSISKITANKKGFTVKWKKQTTQTTGYQIQYSTSSKFASAKTVTVSKNSTTSKAVKSLKAKKKYYVRVRTYKTVNGQKYYSAWSKAKTVTTKK